MQKVILAILDGWGASDEGAGNAIRNAKTPNIDMLVANYPNTVLQASGVSVGLPWGTPGNSEVGHLTIGAGKVLYQNLPRVTLAVQNHTFFEMPTMLEAIKHALERGSNIHIMGLLGDGSVHSHINHLYAILEMLKMNGVPADKVFIHAFTDGRDVDPQSGKRFVVDLANAIKNEGYPGSIASIMGRYFAMDRNSNWDRTQRAYYALVHGVAAMAIDPREALEESYHRGVTDEFVEPTLIKDATGNVHTIKPGDTVIFYNIREDRARQLTKAFVLDPFDAFDRGPLLTDLYFATMVQYEKGLPAHAVFEPEEVRDPLGKVISDQGLRQLRIAETEKYAHVTYFFNGGNENPFPNENRLLIPSPDVDYYDKTPEMSAELITVNAVKAMQDGNFDFILLNYANPDMVGHTGNIKAATRAVEYVDTCVGQLYDAAVHSGYVLLITADHGNVEEMVNLRTGDKDTEHSTNPVPFILVDNARQFDEPRLITKPSVGGMLSDVAPTVLDIMGIPEPAEMTGTSLLGSI